MFVPRKTVLKTCDSGKVAEQMCLGLFQLLLQHALGWGLLKHRNLLLMVPEAGSPRSQHWPFGCLMSPASQCINGCLLSISSYRGRGVGDLWGPFNRTPVLNHEAPPSWPKHLPEASPPYITIVGGGGGYNMWILGGHKHSVCDILSQPLKIAPFTCKIYCFHLNSPLNLFQCQLQSLISKVSSKCQLNQIQVRCQAWFILTQNSAVWTCETRQILCIHSTGWDRKKLDIPISKGRNQNEERGDRSQTSSKPSKANPSDLKSQDLFGLVLHSPAHWRSSIYVDQEGNPIHVAVCEGMGGWPSWSLRLTQSQPSPPQDNMTWHCTYWN